LHNEIRFVSSNYGVGSLLKIGISGKMLKKKGDLATAHTGGEGKYQIYPQ